MADLILKVVIKEANADKFLEAFEAVLPRPAGFDGSAARWAQTWCRQTVDQTYLHGRAEIAKREQQAAEASVVEPLEA